MGHGPSAPHGHQEASDWEVGLSSNIATNDLLAIHHRTASQFDAPSVCTDLAEARAVRTMPRARRFQEIKATLDAYRLLAALSYSHALVVGKYQIVGIPTRTSVHSPRVKAQFKGKNLWHAMASFRGRADL